jgi:Kef-type K+ transport system membrane component KefB
MSTTEIFLIAMLIIFTVPYLIWRVGKTNYFAPLVVVQIIAGILLGPGIFGAVFPEQHILRNIQTKKNKKPRIAGFFVEAKQITFYW